MVRLILVWVFAVVVMACSSERRPNYVVLVDCEFGNETIEAVRAAANEWSSAYADAAFDIRVGPRPAYLSEDQEEWPENVIVIIRGEPGPNENWEGLTLTSVGSNSSLMRLRRGSETRVDLITHELGHAMLLSHADGGIMQTPLGVHRHVTCVDVARLCQIWGNCGPCNIPE